MRPHTPVELKLKRIRKEYNLTQTDMADWLCVPAQTVKNIEAGKAAPRKDFLKFVAVVFDVELNWLLDDSQPVDTFCFPYSSIAELGARFRNLNEEHQGAVLALMRYFEEREKKETSDSDHSDID